MKFSKQGHKHLLRSDVVLAKIMRVYAAPPPFRRHGSYFHALCREIISQQLSTKAASTIYKRFLALFPGQRFPTPAQVSAMPAPRLRKAGMSNAKARYVKDLARQIDQRKVNLRQLHRLEDELVIEQLTQIKGIGRWTAEMFLMFQLSRPDVFSHGDLGLRNAIAKLYGFKKPPTIRQIENIVAKWQPHRSLASWYLWQSLDNKK